MPSLTAVINSFRPKIIRVNVAKKPYRLQDSVLAVSDEEPGTGDTSGERESRASGKLWSVVGRYARSVRTFLSDCAALPCTM